MSEIAKQTENRREDRNSKGKFIKKNKAGLGRPKGAKDKIPRIVKEDLIEVFDGMGGVEGVIKWGKKSLKNQEKIYEWYFSMLPKNVDIGLSGKIDSKLTIEVVETK